MRCYVDALYAGAEDVIGADRTAVIEQTAEQLVPGIADEPAWPVLRAHLVLIEARGRDAAHDLASVVAERELDGVRDRAAILDWRLDPTGLRGSRPGPLPWLPAIPARLADHPDWGPYLGARASRVDNLTQQVREHASTGPVPVWARHAASTPAADVLAEVTVWRAATNVPTDDRRPTGAPQLQKAAALWQRRLDEQLTGGHNPALAEWGPLIGRHAPSRDPFTTLLAERLATISRSGLDASGLLRAAAAEGPLPDDHAAAALWWRISAHLSPAVAAQIGSDRSRLVAGWADALVDRFGQDRAAAITQSPSWPALVIQMDHAIGRGWAAADLLDIAAGVEADDVDPAQTMVWRIAIVTDPPPLPENREPSRFEPDPADTHVGYLEQLFPLEEHLSEVDEQPASETTPRTMAPTTSPDMTLAAAMVDRELLGPLEPTDADIDRLLDWADQIDHCPVPRERLLQVNEQALAFYESHYPPILGTGLRGRAARPRSDR